MSERQRVVLQAVHDLGKVGLRITGLECRPEIFAEIASEWGIRPNLLELNGVPQHTFCGIPIKQVVEG